MDKHTRTSKVGHTLVRKAEIGHFIVQYDTSHSKEDFKEDAALLGWTFNTEK